MMASASLHFSTVSASGFSQKNVLAGIHRDLDHLNMRCSIGDDGNRPTFGSAHSAFGSLYTAVTPSSSATCFARSKFASAIATSPNPERGFAMLQACS